MKVTRNTYETLIVEDRPVLITALLGFFFLGALAGALAAWITGEWLAALALTFMTAFIALFLRLFVRRVQVIFQRETGTLTFRTRSLSGYREIIHRLDELSHAQKEGYDMARCVLIFDKGMSEGTHPITDYSTNGPAPQRITDAINAWLKDTGPVDSKGP